MDVLVALFLLSSTCTAAPTTPTTSTEASGLQGLSLSEAVPNTSTSGSPPTFALPTRTAESANDALLQSSRPTAHSATAEPHQTSALPAFIDELFKKNVTRNNVLSLAKTVGSKDVESSSKDKDSMISRVQIQDPLDVLSYQLSSLKNKSRDRQVSTFPGITPSVDVTTVLPTQEKLGPSGKSSVVSVHVTFSGTESKKEVTTSLSVTVPRVTAHNEADNEGLNASVEGPTTKEQTSPPSAIPQVTTPNYSAVQSLTWPTTVVYAAAANSDALNITTTVQSSTLLSQNNDVLASVPTTKISENDNIVDVEKQLKSLVSVKGQVIQPSTLHSTVPSFFSSDNSQSGAPNKSSVSSMPSQTMDEVINCTTMFCTELSVGQTLQQTSASTDTAAPISGEQSTTTAAKKTSEIAGNNAALPLENNEPSTAVTVPISEYNAVSLELPEIDNSSVATSSLQTNENLGNVTSIPVITPTMAYSSEGSANATSVQTQPVKMPTDETFSSERGSTPESFISTYPLAPAPKHGKATKLTSSQDGLPATSSTPAAPVLSTTFSGDDVAHSEMPNQASTTEYGEESSAGASDTAGIAEVIADTDAADVVGQQVLTDVPGAPDVNEPTSTESFTPWKGNDSALNQLETLQAVSDVTESNASLGFPHISSEGFTSVALEVTTTLPASSVGPAASEPVAPHTPAISAEEVVTSPRGEQTTTEKSSVSAALPPEIQKQGSSEDSTVSAGFQYVSSEGLISVASMVTATPSANSGSPVEGEPVSPHTPAIASEETLTSPHAEQNTSEKSIASVAYSPTEGEPVSPYSTAIVPLKTLTPYVEHSTSEESSASTDLPSGLPRHGSPEDSIVSSSFPYTSSEELTIAVLEVTPTPPANSDSPAEGGAVSPHTPAIAQETITSPHWEQSAPEKSNVSVALPSEMPRQGSSEGSTVPSTFHYVSNEGPTSVALEVTATPPANFGSPMEGEPVSPDTSAIAPEEMLTSPHGEQSTSEKSSVYAGFPSELPTQRSLEESSVSPGFSYVSSEGLTGVALEVTATPPTNTESSVEGEPVSPYAPDIVQEETITSPYEEQSTSEKSSVSVALPSEAPRHGSSEDSSTMSSVSQYISSDGLTTFASGVTAAPPANSDSPMEGEPGSSHAPAIAPEVTSPHVEQSTSEKSSVSVALPSEAPRHGSSDRAVPACVPLEPPRSPTHEFRLVFNTSAEFSWEQVEALEMRIHLFSNDSACPQHFARTAFTLGPPHELSWTDPSANTSWCDRGAVDTLLHAMRSHTGHPTPEVTRAFYPEFKVVAVELHYRGACTDRRGITSFPVAATAIGVGLAAALVAGLVLWSALRLLPPRSRKLNVTSRPPPATPHESICLKQRRPVLLAGENRAGSTNGTPSKSPHTKPNPPFVVDTDFCYINPNFLEVVKQSPPPPPPYRKSLERRSLEAVLPAAPPPRPPHRPHTTIGSQAPGEHDEGSSSSGVESDAQPSGEAKSNESS